MSQLQNNTLELQNILETINNLPNNSSSSENLDAEISTQSTLLSEQDAKIAELAQVLAGKASGGSEQQPTLINFTIKYGNENSPTILNCQAESGMSIGSWIFSDYNNTQLIYGAYDGQCLIDIDQATIKFNFVATVPYLEINNLKVTAFDVIQPNGVYSALYHICCFVGGTQILTSLNGETKSIEDIKVGDSVVSYDIKSGSNYITKVNRIITHENTTDIAEIIFDNGTTVTMNAYHPLYTDKGWHSITNYNNYDTLIIGDNVKTIDGWTKILNIKRYTSEPVITYNIDVIDINEIHDINYNDNYYANGIVAHNPIC